jgi:hypothetical protein
VPNSEPSFLSPISSAAGTEIRLDFFDFRHWSNENESHNTICSHRFQDMGKNKNIVNAALKREAKKRQERADEAQQKLNDAEQRDIASNLDDQHTILNPAHPDDAPLTIDELASLGLQRSSTAGISGSNSPYESPSGLGSLAHAGLSALDHDVSAHHDTNQILRNNGADKLAFPAGSMPSLLRPKTSADDEAPAASPERAGTGEAAAAGNNWPRLFGRTLEIPDVLIMDSAFLLGAVGVRVQDFQGRVRSPFGVEKESVSGLDGDASEKALRDDLSDAALEADGSDYAYIQAWVAAIRSFVADQCTHEMKVRARALRENMANELLQTMFRFVLDPLVPDHLRITGTSTDGVSTVAVPGLSEVPNFIFTDAWFFTSASRANFADYYRTVIVDSSALYPNWRKWMQQWTNVC